MHDILYGDEGDEGDEGEADADENEPVQRMKRRRIRTKTDLAKAKTYLTIGGAKSTKCTFCNHNGACETIAVWLRSESTFVLKVSTYQLHVRPRGSRHNGAGDPCGVAFANALRAMHLEWDNTVIDIGGFLAGFELRG